jgi:hypothetical protein
MATDPLLDRFSDLTVPGKRKPVNRDTVPEPVQESAWDEHPVKYMIKGVEKEFFTISGLACALNKSVVTIRSWENKGLIPRTPYRSPKPRGEGLPNTSTKGKRLWTRDQILGTMQIAREESVIFNGKAPTKRFAQRVNQLYITLLKKENS